MIITFKQRFLVKKRASWKDLVSIRVMTTSLSHTHFIVIRSVNFVWEEEMKWKSRENVMFLERGNLFNTIFFPSFYLLACVTSCEGKTWLFFFQELFVLWFKLFLMQKKKTVGSVTREEGFQRKLMSWLLFLLLLFRVKAFRVEFSLSFSPVKKKNSLHQSLMVDLYWWYSPDEVF